MKLAVWVGELAATGREYAKDTRGQKPRGCPSNLIIH